MKNAIQLLAKNVLFPLGITAAVTGVNRGIHKKS